MRVLCTIYFSSCVCVLLRHVAAMGVSLTIPHLLCSIKTCDLCMFPHLLSQSFLQLESAGTWQHVCVYDGDEQPDQDHE